MTGNIKEQAARVLGDQHTDAGTPLGDLAEALRRIQNSHWVIETRPCSCGTANGYTRSGRCGNHGPRRVKVCAACRESICRCNLAQPQEST